MTQYQWLLARLQEPFSNECVEWPFYKEKNGYGKLRVLQKKGVIVSRLVTQIVHGPNPPDKPHACHSCDNPSCFNPNHLEWDTISNNVKAGYDRGDALRRRGEDSGSAKLRELDIRYIFCLWDLGHSASAIASEFDIEENYVRRILRGESWTHLGMSRSLRHLTQLTEEQVREAFNLYHYEGKTLQEVADLFNVNDATIGYITRGSTWKHLNLISPKPVFDEFLAAVLYEQGMTVDEVAKWLKTPRTTTLRRLRAFGVKLRRGPTPRKAR